MLPQILPPEDELVTGQRVQLKLRHLPLVWLYLGGILAALCLFILLAILIEAFAAIAAVLMIAGVLMVGVPLLLLASRSKRYPD